MQLVSATRETKAKDQEFKASLGSIEEGRGGRGWREGKVY
jgi:hypothetical protein